MERLLPQVQHYAWGSETHIPELLGVEPDGQPWAELWIGDHPRLPSVVASTGEPLDAGLPFLLKALAAAEPLSIQSHPSLEQAIAGFAAENQAGVPLDAPNRTYRDANHKPELICALTPFDALVGFRTPEAIIDELGAVDALAPMIKRLKGARPLQTTVEWLLRMPEQEVSALVAEVVPVIETAALLDSFYPGGRGVLVGLLLHRVMLQPGEAVFLGAGNMHAYLSGFGIEIMANSDNVIRGGLTPKHINVEELLQVVSFDAFEPDVQRATGPEHRFSSAGAGFVLTRYEAPDEAVVETAGPELLFVTSGRTDVERGDGSEASLEVGEAAFVEGGSTYTLRGTGVTWRASTEG